MSQPQQIIDGYRNALKALEGYEPKKLTRFRYYRDDCACAVGAIAESYQAKECFENQKGSNVSSDASVHLVYHRTKTNSILEHLVQEIPLGCLEQIQSWNDDCNSTDKRRYEFVCEALRGRIENLTRQMG